MKRLRVGVLMGGMNNEKEVSFNSGRTICDHLDTERFTVIPLFQTFTGKLYLLPLHFLHRGKTTDFEHRLATEAEAITWDGLKRKVDFLYLAVHGRSAEDGTLQGMLEVLGIPYLGSKVFTSALCMDKPLQRDFLQINGLPIPKGLVVSPQTIQLAKKDESLLFKQLEKTAITFPCIVKPHKEGSSLGVSVVKQPADLIPALEKACSIHPGHLQNVLIEEKIEGMEFSCIVIENEQGNSLPLIPTEIVIESTSDFFDYNQKYMPGRATKYTPARCSPEQLKKIQDTCVAVKEALGIATIARIDGFLATDGTISIIDPNTLSGMGPTTFIFLQAAELGISHTDLINHLIDTDLRSYGMLAIPTKQTKKTMDKQKIRIAVLLGGNSNEREISLESGRNVTYKLSPQKYNVTPIFVSSKMELYPLSQRLLVRNTTAEIETEVDPKTKIGWHALPDLFDFVFIGLHGGAGENGAVQGALETLRLPYNGSSVFASALCMDKYKTNQLLKQKGFSVPKNILVNKAEWFGNQEQILKKIEQELIYPIIIKPHDDGCSVLVRKAHNTMELTNCVTTLFQAAKETAMIEEYITGMELTVGVLGNDNPTALPPSQAIATGGILSIEEKFLPGAGENQTPAPLTKEALAFVQKEIAAVFSAAHCRGYARIDCFYQDKKQSPTGNERIVIIEINTLPGLTPATCIFHQAAEAGMKPMDFIDKIVELGFEAHLAQHRPNVKQTSRTNIT